MILKVSVLIMATFLAPGIAALPLLLGDYLGITGYGEGIVMIPLISYLYGTPISVIIGAVAVLTGTLFGNGEIMLYLIGPFLLVVLGVGLFLVGYINIRVYGHRPARQP